MDKTRRDVIYYISMKEQDAVRNRYMIKQKLDEAAKLLEGVGIINYDVYIDEGIEEPIWQKPQIKQLLDKVEHNEIDAFVVQSIFDLGDSFIDSIEFMKQLAEKNIRVISIANNIDTAIYSDS